MPLDKVPEPKMECVSGCIGGPIGQPELRQFTCPKGWRVEFNTAALPLCVSTNLTSGSESRGHAMLADVEPFESERPTESDGGAIKRDSIIMMEALRRDWQPEI